MSDLIVPDDSYISIEFADNYHAKRASAEKWQALSAPDKAKRLVNASDYVDFNYRLKGKPTKPDQVRAFPRNGADDVPNAVRFAVCELALQSDLTANEEAIQQAVKIGDLSVTYAETGVGKGTQRFQYVAQLLSDHIYTDNAIQFAKLVR